MRTYVKALPSLLVSIVTSSAIINGEDEQEMKRCRVRLLTNAGRTTAGIEIPILRVKDTLAFAAPIGEVQIQELCARSRVRNYIPSHAVTYYVSFQFLRKRY